MRTIKVSFRNLPAFCESCQQISYLEASVLSNLLMSKLRLQPTLIILRMIFFSGIPSKTHISILHCGSFHSNLHIVALQALLPVICVVAPLAILFALVYSRINIGPYASFAAILFSWQPCPHVYISLCFVSPFRRRIRAIMHCRRIEASDLRTATAIIPSTKSVGGQFEGLTPIK